MTTDTSTIYRADKCARIIEAIAELYGVTLEAATDIYYQSETAALIEDKVADLHCRSDKYLATVVWEEYTCNK